MTTNDEYEIVYVEKREEAAWNTIGNGLQNFDIQHAGSEGFVRPCFAVFSSNQEIVGDVTGEIYWDWLHIDLRDIPRSRLVVRYFLQL